MGEKLTYRFEDIEIDTQRACVTRGGEETHLRRQVFQVLLYLIEQRQRLVSKEELIEALWHNTAVTDNALVQCIADIRRALGDDTHKPRFIRTIPKLGYRFVGEVEAFPARESGATAGERASPLEVDPGTGQRIVGAQASASEISMLPPARLLKWKPILLLSLAGLVILSAALWIFYKPGGARNAAVSLQPAPGKKSLAVMFFENQSAKPDLDWLREGLADMIITDLARSERLIVLSRQQLHLILERMGHKPVEKISLNAALEIARRSSAEAVILGSYTSLGQQVRVDVQLHDASNGQILTAEHMVVDRPEDILTQVDLLALRLGSRLGAAPPESDKTAGLSAMMTGNLEAYRYYSLGLEKAHAFENAEAIRFFESAIKLDPKFAMAYARIGYAYAVTDFLPEKGRPYLEKAFELSLRLTEKDRLYMMAWDAIARGDYPNAVQMFRQIVAQHPLETEAYWRLGRLLHGEQRSEEAASVLRQGLAMDPEAKDLYNGLGVVLLGLHQYDEAIAAHRRLVELAPDEANSHDSLGMSFQQSGRYDQAVAEYRRALALNPEFEPSIIQLGDAYFGQGRYREAIAQYRRYIKVTQSTLAQALGYSSIAHVFRRKGDLRQAEQAAENEMRLESGAVWNSLVLALERKDNSTAEELRQKLFGMLPYPQRGARHDLRSLDYYRGILHLKAGNGDQAVSDFNQALKYVPPTSGIELYEDCLANAYLILGRWNEAIQEYQRILRFNPYYPLAQFHLGQAFERKGDSKRAQAAYERFLEIWKSADPDIPEVIDAKKKLARPNLTR